jgi:hypothetical protein
MNGPDLGARRGYRRKVSEESGDHFFGRQVLTGQAERLDSTVGKCLLFGRAPTDLGILHEDRQAELTDISEPPGVFDVLVRGDSVVL